MKKRSTKGDAYHRKIKDKDEIKNPETHPYWGLFLEATGGEPEPQPTTVSSYPKYPADRRPMRFKSGFQAECILVEGE